MAKYLTFETEQEAIAAEAAKSAAMGYARPGVSAATGEVVPDVLTLRWAVPQQIADGRYVFASPDDSGEESQESWWVVESSEPY